MNILSSAFYINSVTTTIIVQHESVAIIILTINIITIITRILGQRYLRPSAASVKDRTLREVLGKFKRLFIFLPFFYGILLHSIVLFATTRVPFLMEAASVA